ncbi:hypothetical protein A33M_0177 [Rhodovulum sp. PH10]|nr:hypothetical protein A33M_0177 [Rhodovulum sp. PH10]
MRWATPALRELEAIGDFVAKNDVRAADTLVSRILDHTDRLATHPHLGRAGRVPGTRELVVGDAPFLVAYRVRNDVVEVLAVLHGARRWPDSLGCPLGLTASADRSGPGERRRSERRRPRD